MKTTTKVIPQTGDTWIDSEGDPVKIKYITKRQKTAEKAITSIVNKAIELEAKLIDLFKEAEKVLLSDYMEMLAEGNVEFNPENYKTFTMTNFRKQLYLVRDWQEPSDFNSEKMQLAKAIFEKWVAEKVPDETIAKIINDVFKVSGNRFDSRKISVLLGLRNENMLKDDQLFQDAINAVLDAKIKGSAKRYVKIMVKDPTKKDALVPINLNFSTIYKDVDEVTGSPNNSPESKE